MFFRVQRLHSSILLVDLQKFIINSKLSKKIAMLSKNLIKQVRSLEMKKFRKETNLFVAEGEKLVSDLIASD